jgi:hypothetical protein
MIEKHLKLKTQMMNTEKITRNEIVEFIENNTNLSLVEASGSGYDWDLLVFDDEDCNEALELYHWDEYRYNGEEMTLAEILERVIEEFGK